LPQLDRWLSVEMKQQRKFGKRDRYYYSEILFAVVRFGYLAAFLDFARGRAEAGSREGLAALLEASIEPFGKIFGSPEAALQALRRMPPPVLFHLVGRRYEAEGQTWPLAGGAEVADQRLLDALFEAFARRQAAGDALAPQLLWAGVPLEFAAALGARIKQSGWNARGVRDFLALQSGRPPLWLRLNHPQRREEVLTDLRRHGLEVAAEGAALCVSGAKGIYETDAYQNGLIEIQDWASQRIGAAVDAKPGELVWDACAGGGGKTIQIAARLANRGAVYASDIREYKLKEVRRRAARARFDNVRSFAWAGDRVPELAREVAKQGGFHWVLVDAPCTSSGTWRRNPDAKFRLSTAGLTELTALQGRLLQMAAGAVRPGGHLVYSSCSWLVEEDEAVVDGFLARNPNFELVRRSLEGAPGADADTMFSAVLLKSPGGVG
jgi:16S rRNA (cytosine967-C5)-methyltransferase